MSVLRRIAFSVLLATALTHAGDAEKSGLGPAKKELSELVPLALEKECLRLDYDAWETALAKLNALPKDERRIHVARINGRNVDQVTDTMLALELTLDRAVVGQLFSDTLDLGGGARTRGSRSQSGTRMAWLQEREHLRGALTCDIAKKEFDVLLAEKVGAERYMRVEDDPVTGLTIRVALPKAKLTALFVQSLAGPASLIVTSGTESTALTAENFSALLQRAPEKMQINFLRPLSDLGLQFPPNPHLPPVIAAATSGFGAAAPEAAKRADELLAQLAQDDQEVREAATVALIQLYPQAVHKLKTAAETSADAEVKTRLQRVVQSHPGILRALPYVEEKGLHKDKAYLMNIFANIAFFKAAARTRLAELYGKDFGDDPAAWPKP